jgi:hypothetical protein
MVRISRQRLAASRPQRRTRRHEGGSQLWQGAAGLLAMILLFGVYFTWLSERETVESAHVSALKETALLRGGPAHPQLHLADKNSDQYDALAMDILQTLGCATLMNVTSMPQDDNVVDDDIALRQQQDEPADFGIPPRRLLEDWDPLKQEDIYNESQEQKEDTVNAGIGLDDAPAGVDDFGGGGGAFLNPNAQHLFCLVAASDETSTVWKDWPETMRCDANRHRKTLLDLWNMARSEMSVDLLKQVLAMSYEGTYSLVDQTLNLWDPALDTGLDYMIQHVNNKTKTVDDGGLYGLEHNLGPGRLLVDVGSGLGTTSMAMSLLYPGTRIVSIEVAAPNWLLQEMNWRCNADILVNPPDHLLLAGVGPAAIQESFAKYLWKPDLTTATRSWTPASERNLDDIELSVRLQSWHEFRARAEFQHVDVLNVDCGACEYNFIPALTDAEFDAIHTVMGGLHWGYIPDSKKPSSQRGKETHARLCRHENFAKMAKECCDVADLPVISSYPDQILVHDEEGQNQLPKAGTVADVAGSLCDDFSTWAKEKRLHDIPNDYGWFQISSVAEGY